MVQRLTLLLGATALVAGAIACSGGGGGPLDVDTPWGRPPGSTFEAPPGRAGQPPSSLDPAPAPTDSPTGNARGTGCPPCGTYTCPVTIKTTTNGQPTSSTIDAPVTLQQQADGSCAFGEKQKTVFVLACGGSVTDANGKVLGTWRTSGGAITLASSDSSVPPTTCTVGGNASTTNAPPPSATGTATSVPVASPPQPLDAGF